MVIKLKQLQSEGAKSEQDIKIVSPQEGPKITDSSVTPSNPVPAGLAKPLARPIAAVKKVATSSPKNSLLGDQQEKKAKSSLASNQGEADEDEGEDKEPRVDAADKLRSKLYKVADIILQYPKLLLFLISVPILFKIGIFVYYFQVLSDAQSAYQKQEYHRAITGLEEYMGYEDDDDYENIIMLVKSYAQIGKYRAAERALDNFQQINNHSISVEEYLLYYAVFAAAENNKDKAQDYLDKVLVTNKHNLVGLYLQAIIHFNDKNKRVVSTLDEVIEKITVVNKEQLAYSEEQIHFIRNILYKDHSDIIREVVSLPVATENKQSNIIPLDEFRLPLDSFRNEYYVPIAQKDVINEKISVMENLHLLKAIAHLEDDDTQKANETMDLVARANANKSSLYYLYVRALIAVKNGDYNLALEFYRAVADHTDSADVNIMMASALWSQAQGNSEKLLDGIAALYSEALERRPNDAIAIANLGYIRIYQNDLVEARRVLEKGAKIASDDFNIVYNLSILNILEGNFDKAHNNLAALRGIFPDSLPLVMLQVNALIYQSKYSEATALLEDSKQYISSPEIYIAIADVYGKHEQPLLVVSKLTEGRIKFPNDHDILLELLLEYAKIKDIKRYTALRRISPVHIMQEDYRAFMAAALINENNPEEEAGYFKLALDKTKNNKQKEEVFLFWLRRSINIGNTKAAQEVVQLVKDTYGEHAPRALRVMQIWVRALTTEADEETKKQMLAELETLNVKPLSPSKKTDVALAFLVLDDYSQAASILSVLSRAHDVMRVLNGLKDAYVGLNQTDNVEAVERRIRAIVEKDNDNGKSEEYIRAAEKIKSAGLIFSCSDNDKGCESDSSQADVASGGGNLIDKLNKAVAEKNYQVAIDIYAKLLEKEKPPFTPAIMHQNRGVLYLKLESYEEAANEFKTALTYDTLQPKDRGSILYNYTLALAKNKKYQEGADIIKSLLEMDENNVRALVLYSQLLSKLREYKLLVPVYQKITENSPGHISTYFELARVQRINSDVDGALNTMLTALDVSPQEKRVHLQLAELYLISGDKKKSQEHNNIAEGL